MARLDPFIDLIFKEQAEVLLLETGAPAAIVKGDKIRPAMARSLTTAQIAGACAELVPAYHPAPEPETATAYAVPATAVTANTTRTAAASRCPPGYALASE